MKKAASFVVLLISLLAVFGFSSSAADGITSIDVNKDVYSKVLLTWEVENLKSDYYFEVYLDYEKIDAKINYNGSYFYCYIDGIMPGELHKYTVDYYAKNGSGGYAKIDSQTENSEVPNYFYYYDDEITCVSESCDTVTLEWDYDESRPCKIIDPSSGKSLFGFYEVYYYIYMKDGYTGWSKVGKTDEYEYTVKGLEEDKTYQFKIKACSENKITGKMEVIDESDPIEVKTIVEYFENMTVDSITETSAVIKWGFDKQLLMASGLYADDVSFDVYLKETYSSSKKLGTTSENQYEVTGLEKGEDYTFYVVANCTRLNGITEKIEVSDDIDVETIVLYFKSIKVQNIKSGTAELVWNFDEKSYNNDNYKYYDGDYYYYVYSINEKGKAERVGKTQGMKYTLKDLEGGKLYNFKVVAYYKEYYEDSERIEASQCVEFRTLLAPAEKIIISYDPDFKTATVKWSVVDNANGYILYRYDYDLKEYERLAKQKGRTYEFSYTSGEKYKFYIKPYQTVNGKDTAGEGASKTFLPASKITLSVTSNTLKVGKNLTIKPIITPSSSTDSIKWTTSNSKIVTVSSKGVVKALKNGTATITAITSSGKKASINIIVSNAAISSTSKTVNIGQKITLKINNYSGSVKWSTSNKKIATVSSSGVVKGIAKGTATITAKLSNGATLSCNVKVTKAFISPSKLSILIDQSSKLTLMNATSSVSWSSSNSKIAKVDKKGNVIGVAKGTATIYATCGGVRYSCVVTVKTPPVTFKKVGWYIGSAGGVYPQMVIKNNTKKDIGKVEFNVFFLQADGSYSYCDIYSDYEWILYTIGTLKAGKTMTFEWSEAVHWNVNVSALYFDKVTVYYTDGTSYTYDCDTLWYDNNYYGKK